jgi:hypothetical protein
MYALPELRWAIQEGLPKVLLTPAGNVVTGECRDMESDAGLDRAYDTCVRRDFGTGQHPDLRWERVSEPLRLPKTLSHTFANHSFANYTDGW